MGYMGMGLQQWIYGMQPRKPFSVEPKKTFTALPKYSRTFKLQPSKPVGNFYIIFSLLLLSFFLVVVFVKKPAFLEHARKVQVQKAERIEVFNKEAFLFLMKSGKSRLQDNNVIGAYSEFKLAHNLCPKNKEAMDLLFNTTYILCANNNAFCKELDVLVNNF